jgi:hypothetical protein
MIKREAFVFVMFLATAVAASAAPRTMRVDYDHTGNATEERFALDRVVLEPLEWPGNPARPLDDTNLGKYFFEVVDRKSNRVIYSRGFASVFGEWETTGEAKERFRTFSESLRFPAPSAPVQILVKKRDSNNAFREIWSTLVDPAGMFVDPSKPPSPGPLLEIEKHGPPAEKIDFLILGDGYTAAERAKFEKDARRLTELLFAVSPFKERRSDFNVWGLCPPTEESGISRPSTGIHRRSRVGATYDAFGSERYVLTFENRSFRDVRLLRALRVRRDPDELPDVRRGRDLRAVFDGRRRQPLGALRVRPRVRPPFRSARRRVLHLGRRLRAGIGAEGRALGAERLRPARSRQAQVEGPRGERDSAADALAEGKVRDDVARFPGPTPEDPRRQRTGGADGCPFSEEKTEESRLLGGDPHAGKVGAFEGAMYEAKGYFRPQIDCIMFTRDDVGFCAVCRRAIQAVMDLYSKG